MNERSAFHDVLAMFILHPHYRRLTLEDFIKILYSAEAEHVLLYGRRMGFADDLSEKLAGAVTSEYAFLSDSEAKVIQDKIDEFLHLEGREQK